MAAAEEEILVNALLVGAREYLANAQKIAAANDEIAASEDVVGRNAETATKRGYLMNQGLFTARRLLYGTTLAFIGLGAEALKMGWNFDKSMQVARVAMQGFLPSTAAINTELNKLYNFAAYTPFQFQDIVLATRKILPFTDSVGQANNLIKDLVNSLAAMGVTTAAALNRGALALAHMLSMGRVTGLALNQLSRDNVPMLKALAYYYHTTTEEIRAMVTKGLIPASVGVKALNDYINNTKGWSGAAMRVATHTLSGAFTTFKDIIMKSFGSAEGGLFSSFQHLFQGVDMSLSSRLAGGQSISITNLANAFDQVLSPKTHVVINLFMTFMGVLKGVLFGFSTLASMIHAVLGPLALLTGGGHNSQMAFKAFGFVLGIVITYLITYKAVTIAARIATEAFTIWTRAAAAAVFLYEVWVLRAEYAQLLATKAMWLYVIVTNAFAVATGLASDALEALWALFLADPVLWIVLAIGLLIIGLVVLFQRWTFFHNLVMDTWNWIKQHWMLLTGILLGPFAAAAVMIYQHWNSIKNFVEGIYNWIVKKINNVIGLVGKLWNKIPGHNFLKGAAGMLVPGLAGGGTVLSGGSVLVGESGPELLTLPAGATVSPLNDMTGVGSNLANGLTIVVEPADIYLDNKKVGNIVFKNYQLVKAHQ